MLYRILRPRAPSLAVAGHVPGRPPPLTGAPCPSGQGRQIAAVAHADTPEKSPRESRRGWRASEVSPASESPAKPRAPPSPASTSALDAPLSVLAEPEEGTSGPPSHPRPSPTPSQLDSNLSAPNEPTGWMAAPAQPPLCTQSCSASSPPPPSPSSPPRRAPRQKMPRGSARPPSTVPGESSMPRTLPTLEPVSGEQYTPSRPRTPWRKSLGGPRNPFMPEKPRRVRPSKPTCAAFPRLKSEGKEGDIVLTLDESVDESLDEAFWRETPFDPEVAAYRGSAASDGDAFDQLIDTLGRVSVNPSLRSTSSPPLSSNSGSSQATSITPPSAPSAGPIDFPPPAPVLNPRQDRPVSVIHALLPYASKVTSAGALAHLEANPRSLTPAAVAALDTWAFRTQDQPTRRYLPLLARGEGVRYFPVDHGKQWLRSRWRTERRSTARRPNKALWQRFVPLDTEPAPERLNPRALLRWQHSLLLSGEGYSLPQVLALLDGMDAPAEKRLDALHLALAYARPSEVMPLLQEYEDFEATQAKGGGFTRQTLHLAFMARLKHAIKIADVEALVTRFQGRGEQRSVTPGPETWRHIAKKALVLNNPDLAYLAFVGAKTELGAARAARAADKPPARPSPPPKVPAELAHAGPANPRRAAIELGFATAIDPPAARFKHIGRDTTRWNFMMHALCDRGWCERRPAVWMAQDDPSDAASYVPRLLRRWVWLGGRGSFERRKDLVLESEFQASRATSPPPILPVRNEPAPEPTKSGQSQPTPTAWKPQPKEVVDSTPARWGQGLGRLAYIKGVAYRVVKFPGRRINKSSWIRRHEAAVRRAERRRKLLARERGDEVDRGTPSSEGSGSRRERRAAKRDGAREVEAEAEVSAPAPASAEPNANLPAYVRRALDGPVPDVMASAAAPRPPASHAISPELMSAFSDTPDFWEHRDAESAAVREDEERPEKDKQGKMGNRKNARKNK